MKLHAVCLAIVAVGCNPHPHVQLGPLPPELPAGQRVQIYNDLRATAERERTTTTCSNQGGCSTNVERTLFLANGTEVHHAEDILPVVSPDSASARAARASSRSQQKSRNFTLLGVAGLLVFTVVGASALSGDDEDSDLSTGTKLGLLVGGAAALVGSFGAYQFHYQAVDEQGEANMQYNDGLARRLRVCVNGMFVAPCEAEAATPGGP